MIKAAICGASGYTGAELLRLLAYHPEVEISAVTSEQFAGKTIADIYPHLFTLRHFVFEPLKLEALFDRADLFFLALPHATSQEVVSFFYSHKKKVIDLSADFRIREPKVYEQWYKTPHNCRDVLGAAVYGLPELYREQIRKASLIANPGCYPTSAILGLMPALKENLVDTRVIVIDSKSGASGAGRKSDIALLCCEVNEGFKSYGIATHRHTPEIEQELSVIHGSEIKVNFTPHLLPIDRGILSTMYCRLIKELKTSDVIEIYKEAYRSEPFVHVMDAGLFPDLKDVRGSNYCMLSATVDPRTNSLIIVSVIDNLVKGASGQAVQNMNLMMGFDETTGLRQIGLFP